MENIYLAWKTIDQVNTSEGLHTLFTYSAEVSVIFIPMVFFSFWIIAVIGSFFAQKKITGRGDIAASVAASGYVTFIVAVVMSLVPNLINLFTLVTTLSVAVLGTLWLYLSRRE